MNAVESHEKVEDTKPVLVKELSKAEQKKAQLSVAVATKTPSKTYAKSESSVSSKLNSKTNDTSPSGNVAAITMLHGVTPVSSNSLSIGVPMAGLPVGATPVSLPQVITGAVTNQNNFRILTNFDHLVTHLKERQLLESNVLQLLTSNFSNYELYKLMRCKDSSKPTDKFSELHLKFALVLYLYSPACFKYLNSVFSLPSETVLENMMVSLNFRPGILKESLMYLVDRIIRKGASDLNDCYLIVDSLPIEKNVVWDEESDMFVGRTQLFQTFEYDSNPANQVIFVMVCSLNDYFHLPFAYFPVNEVYPDLLSSIIGVCVSQLAQRNVKVRSIVLDASEASFSCAKILGCCLDLPSKITSSYCHKNMLRAPVIFDANHLAKEARDCLAQADVIGSKVGWIEWKYVQFLNEKLGIKFSNDTKHLNESLTQLQFNLSLAEALEDQRKEGDTIFTCSGPTATFINQLSKALSNFDYSNRRLIKVKVNESIQRIQGKFISDFSPYFRSLKINSENLYQHHKYNFVRGCYFNMNSLSILYDKIKIKKFLVKKDLMKYRLTLDPVDLFYHFTFTKDGHFEMPDCVRFKLGLKKFLSYVKNNTLFLTEIPPLLTDFRSDKRNFKCISIKSEPSSYKLSELYVDMLTEGNLKYYSENILVHICNIIVNDIRKKISCVKCIEMISVSDESLSNSDHNYSSSDWLKELSLIYDKKVYRASKEVIKIVNICEKMYRSISPTVSLLNLPTEYICNFIVAKTKTELFENFLVQPFSRYSHPVHEDVRFTTHEIYLTKLIIENYIRRRVNKIRLCSFLLT